jgi:hypothetical protein
MVLPALVLPALLALGGCAAGGASGGSGGGGGGYGGSPNPVPNIVFLDPSSVAMGGPDFYLTVYGSGFSPSSVVQEFQGSYNHRRGGGPVLLTLPLIGLRRLARLSGTS